VYVVRRFCYVLLASGASLSRLLSAGEASKFVKEKGREREEKEKAPTNSSEKGWGEGKGEG
jgi:hypothetical protein